MLTIKEIAQIYEQADILYRKYRKAYFELQRNFYENAGDVKYSAGGIAYPAGKYFWGKSKVYRKVVSEMLPKSWTMWYNINIPEKV